MSSVVRYYRVVHGFVRDDNEPGEMSIVEGETVKKSPPLDETGGDVMMEEEEAASRGDGWALVQSLRTGEIGYVPAVKRTPILPTHYRG